MTLQYDSDSLISRIFQLENPQFYENMLPFLCQKNNLDLVLEYLIKDFIPSENTARDRSRFTDLRCEKIVSFLMSSAVNLKRLLNATQGYIVSTLLQVFLNNNSFGDADIYQISLLLKFMLVMTPDEFFPHVKGVHIRAMLAMIARNRAVYDVLVLLLCYPEKRTSDLEGVISVHVDEDDEASDAGSELQESYNISFAVLRRHITLLLRLHIIPSIIVVITNQDTDREASDLLCMLLCDMLYKYSYNEKYITLIRELQNDQLIHCIMMFLKVSPNPYIFKLLEQILYLISVTEIPVAPDNYIRFGLLVDNYMDSEFMEIAPQIYSYASIYIMFLIKQLYRHLPSSSQLSAALDARFHLINTFQLGDVSKASTRDENDMHMGSIPVLLLDCIYYILLGFFCTNWGGVISRSKRRESHDRG